MVKERNQNYGKDYISIIRRGRPNYAFKPIAEQALRST